MVKNLNRTLRNGVRVQWRDLDNTFKQTKRTENVHVPMPTPEPDTIFNNTDSVMESHWTTGTTISESPFELARRTLAESINSHRQRRDRQAWSIGFDPALVRDGGAHGSDTTQQENTVGNVIGVALEDSENSDDVNVALNMEVPLAEIRAVETGPDSHHWTDEMFMSTEPGIPTTSIESNSMSGDLRRVDVGTERERIFGPDLTRAERRRSRSR